MIVDCRAITQSGPTHGLLRLEYASATDDTPDWALLQPPVRNNRWIVCIHGHRSGGDQLWTHPLTRTWPTIFRQHGSGILSPNLRSNSWMGPRTAEDLHRLLDFVRDKYGAAHFDFISGSMGGTSNLIYAGLHPADVASVVALCPATDVAAYYDWCRNNPTPLRTEIADAIEKSYRGTPTTQPNVFAAHSALAHTRQLTMPVFIAHGTADAVIPISQSRKFATAMAGAQAFQYEEITGGDHNAPLPAVARALSWVLRQLKIHDDPPVDSCYESAAANSLTNL